MKPYKNKSHCSGIVAYETGKDYIKLKFSDGEIYLYDYKKPGKVKVEKMKALAEAGSGLATFINRYVRKNFSAKL